MNARPANGPTSSRHRIAATLLLLLCILPAAIAWAQPLATLETLTANKTAAEENAALDDDTKKQVVQAWTQAISARQKQQALQQTLKNLKETIREAPRRIEAMKKRLDAGVPPDLRIRIPKKATLQDLEKLVQQQRIRLASLRDKAHQADAALDEWNDTRRELRKRIAEVEQRLDTLSKQIESLSKDDSDQPLDEARLAALKLQQAQRESELKLLQVQLDSEKLLSELRETEAKLANAEVEWLEGQLALLNERIETLRQQRGSEEVSQAEKDLETLADAPAPLQALARKNLALSHELQQTLEEDAHTLDTLTRLRDDIKKLQASEKSVLNRLDAFGPSDAMGRMLRKRLEAVRSIKRISQVHDQEEIIDQLTDRQIDIDEQLEKLADPKQRVAALLASLPPDRREAYRATAERLIERQQALLQSLANLYQRYSSRLLELSNDEARYQQTSDRFERFMRGQLFWMRNTTPVNFRHIEEKLRAATSMLSPTRLKGSLRDVQAGFRQNPLTPIAAMMLALLVLVTQPLASQRITALGLATGHLSTNRYYHTLLALFYTVWRSAGWPLLFGLAAWWLKRIPSTEPYTTALAAGLHTMATVLFTVEFTRQLCRQNGLAQRHFRWPNNIRRRMWRELHWLKYAVTPLSFLIAFTLEVEFTPLIPAIGRPALLLMMLAFMVFTWRMLNAKSPITRYLQQKKPHNWLTQLRFIWFPLLMLLPLVLAVLSILGYHYTAGLLTQRLLYTIWLLLFLLLAKDLFLRWIVLEKRRIAWQEALKRREELRAQRAGEAANGDDESDPEIARLEEQDSVEVYEHLSEQARRIINAILLMAGVAGFWWIWSDLLPALQFLDSVKLPITTTEMVDGVSTEVPVTLADVGVAVIVAIITIMAAKNIPGLLEILILQRLPIAAGARYAITTLSQYLIVAIGIITSFKLIGTQWSSIQWLVAALSVGLGFGLQEIVANFVSGIILLSERPIRVGDVVTIGDTTGTVTRIQIRATTIRNWDRQELLVPNKEFVTGRLLNWTLTDPINRFYVDVGIAYGSDVAQALKLLVESAAEHPRVLDDPEPLVTFEAFGDSALLLRMRCYLDSMEFRTRTRSEVHEIVNRKFEEAGIVIAFPQLDVHLDANEDTNEPPRLEADNGDQTER